MRVALFSPFNTGPVRGNIITVQRIAQHLPHTGWEPAIIPLDTLDERQCDQLVEQFRPDLLHAFHALHSGAAARRMAQRHRLPYLVTMTGSDLYEPALRDHPDTIQSLQDAAAVICFDQLGARQLIKRMPQLSDTVIVIPQGISPLSSTHPFDRPAGTLVVLLPAALRPVKGIIEAIEALAPLTAELPQLRLWLAGGELDQSYAACVYQYANGLPWVTLWGEIPHERMGDLYAACDLVLNNSRFEGGMANTLLEAMAAAKPVIAGDIAGNRSLVCHGKTGWLFKTPQDLRAVIRQLADDEALRRAIGQAARQQVSLSFSPQAEADALAALYSRHAHPL